MEINGNAIETEARKWLGTPYHHQARIRGAGVDCIMLLCEVYHACGLIPYEDPRPYPMDWHLNRSEEMYLGGIEKYGVKVETPQKGDIALYQFGRTISHGAIVLDWPTIIHSYRGEGVVLANGLGGAMAGRLRGFWRLIK